jgi:hypothetical protein
MLGLGGELPWWRLRLRRCVVLVDVHYVIALLSAFILYFIFIRFCVIVGWLCFALLDSCSVLAGFGRFARYYSTLFWSVCAIFELVRWLVLIRLRVQAVYHPRSTREEPEALHLVFTEK